jgi:hypothetical protein
MKNTQTQELSIEVAIDDLRLCAEVVEKAKALIDRWEQPSWKDVEPTAGFINALRDAVRNYEENKNDW